VNTNLLDIVRRIVAEQGEGILGDPQRLKAFFSDLARDEPKPLRLAFGRCVEAGAYAAMKTAPDAAERAERKAAIAQRVRDDQGTDITLCAEALDILEAALYGAQPAPPPVSPSRPQYTPPPPQQPRPSYQQAAPYQQTNPAPQAARPQPAVRTGGLWTSVLVCNILGLNCVSRFITGHIGTGILVLALDIAAVATIDIGIGVILLLAGLVIWIIDLVKIGTKKWQMSDGTYLSP
jgi:hypothetical protein